MVVLLGLSSQLSLTKGKATTTYPASELEYKYIRSLSKDLKLINVEELIRSDNIKLYKKIIIKIIRKL